MRLSILCTVATLWILCILTYPAVGILVDADFFYFPDQTQYIKQAMKCPDNMILWPGDRRCYREGEQGPCNIGRVVAIDRRLWKPYCKEEGLP